MAVSGLKSTSSTIAIGFGVQETAANTFTQESIDLNLSPLDREVFVVMAIDMDVAPPENVANTNTSVTSSLTTTSQTAVQTLEDSNCLARKELAIRANALNAVSFETGSIESPPSLLPYIGIIATNDFFIQVKGSGNTITRSLRGKLYGYRARASADIYAALVQSEVLSA